VGEATYVQKRKWTLLLLLRHFRRITQNAISVENKVGAGFREEETFPSSCLLRGWSEVETPWVTFK
jgi:hypothetical protein